MIGTGGIGLWQGGRWAAALFCIAVCLGTPVAIEANPPAVASSTRLEMARQVVRGLEKDMVTLLDRVTCSTVSVLGCESVQGDDMLTGAGSGVIVNHHGVHVVTNAHVVSGCKIVRVVTCDGRRYPVQVQSIDKSIDLALLRFENAPPVSRAIRLDPRAYALPSEGTWVLAVGNPFLLAMDGLPVASLGVVSGVRDKEHGYSIETRSIQHDAEINPGNSGGPLWSLSGHLLGINGAIVTRSRMQGGGPTYSGASFSVPAKDVMRFIEQATPGVATSRHRPSGSATRSQPFVSASTVEAWLSATYRTTYDARGDTLGAMILVLHPGHPLQGALVGDIITSLQLAGRTYPVRSADDLERAFRNHRAGGSATLALLRGTRRFSVTAAIGR